MRILVLESHGGESDELLREAAERGHEVVRCQPVVGDAVPCNGLVGDGCPFDQPVDVVIDVHPGGLGLAPRELGILCAEQAGVPLVAAGTSPVGEAATETTACGAIDEAERLAADADLRPPTYVVERAARQELQDLGHRDQPVWVSYAEHDGVFDVVIETSSLGPIEQAAIDAAVLPIFRDSMRVRRFGDLIYRQHQAS